MKNIIKLGYGDISVGAVRDPNGNHGICFVKEDEVHIVGSGAREGEGFGETKDSILFQIKSSKPESLDVVIEMLIKARKFFNEESPFSPFEDSQEYHESFS